MESTLRRTWAEIDLDALAHNYHALRKQMGPKSRFLGVVKADAYGHGAIQVARVLEELGAEYLAISNIDEARGLRLGGIGLPILQLGLTPADQTEGILENDVTQAVWSESAAQGFSGEAVRLGGRMKAHIKLDTGMSRLGFQCVEDHFAAPGGHLPGGGPAGAGAGGGVHPLRRLRREQGGEPVLYRSPAPAV